MRYVRFLLVLIVVAVASGCGTAERAPEAVPPPVQPSPGPAAVVSPSPLAATRSIERDPKVLASRARVPVLCYHQVRDWTVDDSDNARSLTTPPERFAEQMDILERDGWTPISPAQYHDHLVRGAPLPDKPIMLTFDDGSDSHWTAVAPELRRRGFTATFFVMTVVLDKPGWLSREQVRGLDRMGMQIGSHTWDHQPVTAYEGRTWRSQLVESRAELAEIVGHPVRWFAYPYGAWNARALPHVAQAGYDAAFQLSDDPDPDRPLMTLRRVLVNTSADAAGFRRQLRRAAG